MIDAQKAIAVACDEVKEMLLAKNRQYGNSALDPVRVFARDIAPDVQLAVRIDDKLSRIARGQGGNEDAELDLLGYLILRRVYRKLHPEQPLRREDRPRTHITVPEGADIAKMDAAVEAGLKHQLAWSQIASYNGERGTPR